MKGLIELRKKYSAFRMATAADVKKYLKFIEAPKNIVAYTLTNPDHNQKNYKLVIIHNANLEAVMVNVPENGIWHVLVNGKQAGTKIITSIKGSSVTVPELSTFVLKKEDLYK
jgi:pullulanase